MMRFIRLAVLLACVLPLAAAAQQGAQITPNYKDADLGQVIEAVSQVTGKNFIVDPRVRAQVTMLSTAPMSPEAFYEAFLAILQVHGYIAVPSGEVIKIMPDATARQVPANDLPDRVSSTSDEIVTQVIQVRNVSAGQLVPILRPMMPQSAHLAAYPSANMLIISDRAVEREPHRAHHPAHRPHRRRRLRGDPPRACLGDRDRARDQFAGRRTGRRSGGRLAHRRRRAHEQRPGQRRAVAAPALPHADHPPRHAARGRRRHAGALPALRRRREARRQAQGTVGRDASPPPAAQPPPQAAAAAGGVDKSVTIWAEPETNALVITAPPKTMRSLMSVIDRLDVRRAQVIIEAMLVEVSNDATRDLGVNWVVDGSGDNFLVGLFNQPIAGVSIARHCRGRIDDPSSATAAPGGFTIGGGRQQDSGTNFAAILRALAQQWRHEHRVHAFRRSRSTTRKRRSRWRRKCRS